MMNDPNRETITISAHEWEELKLRLADVEEHRRGLLKHTQNLEHLVNEATKHARQLEALLQQKTNDVSKFIEHIGNLEHLLKENESDLAQSRTLLNDLKARCYRYEQMLLDHGEKVGGGN
ncbi:MAG: hypothetical protein AB1656_14730 [Candidatus Omnitrophota bacterium]